MFVQKMHLILLINFFVIFDLNVEQGNDREMIQFPVVFSYVRSFIKTQTTSLCGITFVDHLELVLLVI